MTDVAARTYGLQQGTPDLKSIGPITFGPDAILFVADNASATIYAIEEAGSALFISSSTWPAPI